MAIAKLIAKHLREAFFGDNWTWSSVVPQLKEVTWQQASTKLPNLNTIAALTYHIGYYATAQRAVLEGNPLKASDAESFSHPTIEKQEDWENIVQKIIDDVNALAALIEKLDDSKLLETFVEEKYGNYYRNLNGLIEHSHYHLGQIVLIKKMLLQQ